MGSRSRDVDPPPVDLGSVVVPLLLERRRSAGAHVADVATLLFQVDRRPFQKTKTPRGVATAGRFNQETTYCTFNAKSSTTNDVCNELSSEPTRKTWMVWPLNALTSKDFCA